MKSPGKSPTTPASQRYLYGHSIIVAGMDEVARFRFEGAADSHEHVQAVILRGMTDYGGRAILLSEYGQSRL